MKKSILPVFLTLMVMVLLSKAQNQEINSDIIFQTGFEEGNKSIWDDWDGNPDTENKIISDSGPFNTTGNHVIRLFVPSGKRGGSDLVKVLPSQHDSLYLRWYIKYENGFNFNAPNHGGGLVAGDRNYLGQSDNRPNGNDFASATIEYNTSLHTFQIYAYYRGMYQDCSNPQGACWGDHFPCTSDDGKTYCKKPEDREPPLPPVLTTNKWYCVDMKLKMGTASANGTIRNGEIALWVDGISYGKWNNLWMRTVNDLKITILWLSLFHHDETHSAAGILIDDVTVSTGSLLTSSIQKEKFHEKFQIYPNPADKTLKISVPNNAYYKASFYNLQGKLIISEVINNNEKSINIDKLSKGMYYVVLNDCHNNTIIGSAKFICN